MATPAKTRSAFSEYLAGSARFKALDHGAKPTGPNERQELVSSLGTLWEGMPETLRTSCQPLHRNPTVEEMIG